MPHLETFARVGVVALAIILAAPAWAENDLTPSDAAAIGALHTRLEAIETDLTLLHREILAANTAADPAARAAAIDQASGTLARLVSECKDVEQSYAALEGSVPPKTGAFAAAASADLAAIVSDLDAAAGDLDQARTTLASLR
jgi:hypothetical protein